MQARKFKPVLYLKAKCPYCLKLVIFLLEAKLLDNFVQREFHPGDAEEDAIRAEMTQNLQIMSFPSVQYAPGKYMFESDIIAAHYAAEAGVDPATFRVYSSFISGMLPRQVELYSEVAALKKQLAAIHETARAAQS